MASVLGAVAGRHVHPDRISKYTREGMPVFSRGGHGKESVYDLVECIAWYRERDELLRGFGGPATGVLIPEAERARRDAAAADWTELKVAERRGELVPAATVKLVWSKHVIGARTHLLGLPSRAKQRLPHLTAADVVEIDGLVREALEELAGADDAAKPETGVEPKSRKKRRDRADGRPESATSGSELSDDDDGPA